MKTPTTCPSCHGTDIEGVTDFVFGCCDRDCGCRWDERTRKPFDIQSFQLEITRLREALDKRVCAASDASWLACCLNVIATGGPGSGSPKEYAEQVMGAYQERVRNRPPRPTSAYYNGDVYALYLNTPWKGPDGCDRSMSVSGLPTSDDARAFLKFMGWDDIPLTVYHEP